ncbi:MAG: PAS domain-containing protein [Oscillochloris sp.]|nr:PAS domain-containing protein [Oscillochloris sp.]
MADERNPILRDVADRCETSAGLVGCGPGWSGRRRFLPAILLSSLTVWIYLALQAGGQTVSVVLFLLPIILSAYLGGLGPGLLSTAVAGVATGNLLLTVIAQGRFTLAFAEWLLLIGIGVLASVLRVRMRHHDVAARQQAEAALMHSERMLKLFVEHTPAAIAMLDSRMHYIAVSRRFLADYQLPEQDLIGRSHYEVFPEISARWKQIHRRCLDGQRIAAEEDPFPRADGRLDWVRWEILPWYEQPGKVGGIILFSEVITARKLAEAALLAERASLARRVADRTAELRLANQDLARAARLKDEFLASMSHELRTPLTTILGRTELLGEQIYGPITPQQAEALLSIEASGKHLLALINNILDLSQLEADQLNLQIAEVPLRELCDLSLEMIAPSAAARRISPHLAFAAAVETIQADERRLRQVLVNLLDNAIKFTPEGGTIGLEVQSDVARRTVTFTIWDTGIGIADHDQPQVFTPFTQINSGLNREYGGTGLGLALALRLTEAHHGSIDLISSPGRGSRFSVNVPWEQVAMPGVCQPRA